MKDSYSSPTVVLIPAYQPGKTLVVTTQKLVDAGLRVIVVDDGSEIAYQPIFQLLPPAVQLIRHTENKGKGAALKTGYRTIRKSYNQCVIVTADADGQHTINDILGLAEAYRQHASTLMLGVRAFDTDTVPLRSRFGNVMTKNVLFLATRQHISDTQTGLRAFDHSLLDFMLAVPGERFQYETNVLLQASRQHIEIVEYPIQTVYEPNNPSSHFDPIKDSWAIYREIFKFASSSLLAFAVDFGLFLLLHALTASWSLAASVTFANVLARLVSATLNYQLNKRVVFKPASHQVMSAMQYAALAATIMVSNTALINLLTGGLHIAASAAKIITELTLFSLSYVVQKRIIFNPKGELTI